MSDRSTANWDDVRRMADELELKIHLAGMEARDRWQALQPRLSELEKRITVGGERAGQAIEKELSAIGASLRRLWDELSSKPS